MPVIAAFLGILVRVYHGDHDPPHIHVQYGEYEAIVEISSGKLLAGKLPTRVRGLLREWLLGHKSQVLKAWTDAKANKSPHRIKPLE